MFIKFIFCKLFKFYKIIFYVEFKNVLTHRKFQQKNKYFIEFVFKLKEAHRKNFSTFNKNKIHI